MSFSISVDSPILEIKEYCNRTGAVESKVKRQMDVGNFPYIKFSNKKGAKRYVNMLAIYRMAAAADDYIFQTDGGQAANDFKDLGIKAG